MVFHLAGFPLGGSILLVDFIYMKMTSFGISNATNKRNDVNNNEDIICSTENNYSLQSEVYNPKTSARAKFAKNKRAKRCEQLRKIRASGNTEVPKQPTQPPKGKIKVPNDVSDYVHQSMVEHLYPASILEQLRTTLGSLNAEGNISKLYEVLEVIGALAVSLPMCTTKTQVASQIVLSVRALTHGSITENVLKQASTVEWCKDLFGYNIFEEQAGISDAADWLRKLPNLKENWDAVRNAPLFNKIASLISVAASIGLCSVTNLKWSIQGVELFRLGTLQKQASAIDLVGAVLDTIICFIEGGYECFRTCSFEPLLFTNDDSKSLDELYFPLIELHEHAMVFNLHSKPVRIKGEERILNDVEYGLLLDEALVLAERAYKSAKGTWQQSYLEKRREVLHKNRAAYQAKRLSGCMRFAPFCVYIWGESGVGKSTLAQIFMADLLNAAGADPSPKGVAVIKESDKFDSTLKGDTVGIYLDDFGNTRKDFLEKSPIERLIDYNNNMVTYANKADLHEKGKIAIVPKIMVITSNAPLVNHANLGSIKPFSGVRRADVHIEAFVRPSYATPDKRLDTREVSRCFPGDELVTDVWDLELSIPREQQYGGNNKHLISFDNSSAPFRVGIRHALELITDMCVSHFDEQKNIIRRSENLVESRKYCAQCRRAHDVCKCEPVVQEPTEEQVSVAETFEFINEQFTNMGNRWNYILSLVPALFYNNAVVRNLYLLTFHREFLHYERTVRYLIMGSITAAWMAMSFTNPVESMWMPCWPVFAGMIGYICMLARWRAAKLHELEQRRDITSELFASIRRSKMFQFFGMCVLAKALYHFVILFRGISSIQQSALAPNSVEEIDKRDKEENPWAVAVPAELHVDDRAATMTHDQVVRKVSGNLFHGVFVENNFQQTCDVLALGGNVFLMPYHLFRNRKDMKALITKKDPMELNAVFKGIVSSSHIVPIPGKDLCVVSIASGGVFADIKHLFPDAITASGMATFLYREGDGNMKENRIRLNYIKDSESGGPGFAYDLPYNTFTGLCMAVAVTDYARSCIGSVHLRGIPNSPKGKGLIVSRDEISNAIDSAFYKWKSAFPSTVNGDFPTERYEKQVLVNQDIHPNSPVNYLPLGSNLEYIGQGGSRVSHTKSKVRVTPISAIVAEETGVACDYGPPQFHRTRMWQASLAHSANPSPGIEGSLVDLAYADYTDHLIALFKSEKYQNWVSSELTPLTEMETLCGKDGKRFVDAMKKGTSKGFPLSGPKRDMISLLDPIDYPAFQCPASVHDSILKEVQKMESQLLEGKRCYSIFKACVKDEPTKLGKDKVRVFQAADWATQMIIRKYFLPIARLLSLFPLDSECAVGVNAQGPEWDELAQHMKKFGSDRILAGDYSKYDLRMPAQLINAAFKILIEIAQRCGRYSPDDICVMRGIATEVAYSCVAYNGDLIIHKGSNPSGQNLTVYINCIVNSLQLRCAYFHLYPQKIEVRPFREVCAIMTYGDDVKGSVQPGFDWFNHISYAQFLKERDMVFTMPDKESEPTPYMRDEDADFLKRKNIFNPDTGLIHGALDEASIFKSLHTILESKVASQDEICISNIDGALREWWQYGKDVYEMRREQMKKVAARAGYSDHCRMLRESYEDGLQNFRIKYFERSEDEAIDESTFVTTVGDEWDFSEE